MAASAHMIMHDVIKTRLSGLSFLDTHHVDLRRFC